jgi:hypothetical protein
LAGVWEGTADGKTTTLTYTVISGGSALLESMKMPAPAPDMVTVYHRDGDALVATHYCSMGNQPRMRAPAGSATAKSIPFRFGDITNLKPGAAGHIRDLTVTFDDADHLTQRWVSTAAKEKEDSAVFRWVRKR